jgi:DNA mismatch repair ATPase MutS
MKAFLMYKDRDFDLKRPLPPNEQALTQDLALDTLFAAMALDDEYLFKAAKIAVLSSLTDKDTILYRQDILRDCLKHPQIVRGIYHIAIEAIESEKKNFLGFFSRYPGGILSRAVELLEVFGSMLRSLRGIADQHAAAFESEGFSRLFAMLREQLSDAYLTTIEEHLVELRFRPGVLISAELGKGNKGANYVLRKSPREARSWIARLFAQKPEVYTFYLHPRDESGATAVSELKNKGLNRAANALAQATDHILSFFQMLRTELAFYIGCLNLHGQLTQLGEPTCFPAPTGSGQRNHSSHGLYDVCLALSSRRRVVGNDLDADNKDLMIITGANQGGKSTFLRSVGLAQLMMQAGIFVPAQSFCSEIANGIFTHYKREEDITMKKGKLDEELSRMSQIADIIKRDSLLLCNESFAATNEREGSEIARQITTAMVECGIKVIFVTHLYEFARRIYDEKMANAIFLRAEMRADGVRTFRVVEGDPLQTSYGEDLYNQVFNSPSPGRVETVSPIWLSKQQN